jgi:hypothetical protein
MPFFIFRAEPVNTVKKTEKRVLSVSAPNTRETPSPLRWFFLLACDSLNPVPIYKDAKGAETQRTA